MKTQTSISIISMPELEQFLRDELNTLEQKVKNDAEASAIRNLPQPRGDSMNFYWESYHERYQSLISRINQDLQISSHCFSVLQSGERWNAERLVLHNDIRKLQDRLIGVNRKLAGRMAGGSWLMKVLPAASLLLSVTDGIYNRGFFESTGLSGLESWFAAGGLGLGLWAIAHLVFPKVISTPKTMLKKWLAVSGFLLASGGIFYAIGTARTRYREAQLLAEGIYMDISPWPVALLSLLIFIAACGISWYLFQKRSGDSLQRTELEELKAEQKAILKEIEDKKAAIKKLNDDEAAERAHATACIEYGHTLEQMVITAAKEQYHAYKRENCYHRPDGLKPDCFNEPYSFSFTTYCNLDFSRRNPSVVPFIVGLVLLCGSLACSPNPKDVVQQEIVILVDQTDPLTVCPDSVQVAKLLDLNNNLWSGIEVNISPITDKDLNSVQIYSLPAEARLLGNIDVRKSKAKKFSDAVTSAVIALCPGDSMEPMGHSIIYRQLVKSLDELSKSTASQKRLVVFGNLMENSTIVNFYNEATLKKLKTAPDEMMQLFEKAAPLGDYTGIEISFVYSPFDYADNNRYVIVAGLFKCLFKQYGAEVSISASF